MIINLKNNKQLEQYNTDNDGTYLHIWTLCEKKVILTFQFLVYALKVYHLDDFFNNLIMTNNMFVWIIPQINTTHWNIHGFVIIISSSIFCLKPPVCLVL